MLSDPIFNNAGILAVYINYSSAHGLSVFSYSLILIIRNGAFAVLSYAELCP